MARTFCVGAVSVDWPRNQNDVGHARTEKNCDQRMQEFRLREQLLMTQNITDWIHTSSTKSPLDRRKRGDASPG